MKCRNTVLHDVLLILEIRVLDDVLETRRYPRG